MSPAKPALAALLSQVPAFQGLTPEQLDALAAASEVLGFADGQVIVERGTPNREAWVVYRGQAEVVKHLGADRRVTVASLGRGELFGEMSALTGQKATADVVARGPCSAVRIPGPAFQTAMGANPTARRSLGAVISQRCRELIRRK